MAFVEVEHPLGMIPLEEVRAKADKAFPEIMKGLSNWKPVATVTAGAKPFYPAERIKFKGAYASLKQYVLREGVVTWIADSTADYSGR